MGARPLRGNSTRADTQIVVQQPAQDVDFVDQRVVDRHGRDVNARGTVGLRCAAWTMIGAPIRGVDGVFQRDIAGIIAAHEADLHQPAAKAHLGLDDAQRAGGGGRQRLFAEDGLPAAMAASTRGSCVAPVEQTSTASTSSAAIRSSPRSPDAGLAGARSACTAFAAAGL